MYKKVTQSSSLEPQGWIQEVRLVNKQLAAYYESQEKLSL